MSMKRHGFQRIFLSAAALIGAIIFLFVRPVFSQGQKPVDKGKEIYSFYGCYACHAWDGTGGKISPKYVVASAGPSIESIQQSYKDRYGDKWRTELATWIKTPTPEQINSDKKRKEYFDLYGYIMPQLNLSDAEVEAVINFIDTFKK